MNTDLAFDADLLGQIRERFENVESDPFSGQRVYFENAGGTLRLKSLIPVLTLFSGLPDNIGRRNMASKVIGETIENGRRDVALLMGAASGQIISEQSGTGMMFRILSTIARSVPGTNIVTSNLDHPAVYDACHILARRHGLECRVAPLDRRTGHVSPEAVSRCVDEGTVVVAIVHASNILGTVNDVSGIVRKARSIKPDLYVVLDGCQYASHGLIDVETYNADAWVMDAYKIYSKIGTNFAHISDRLAVLDRDNLLGKPAHDWDLGTREPAAFACISRVVEYFQWLGSKFTTGTDPRTKVVAAMRAIESYEQQLTTLLLEGIENVRGLLAMEGLTVYGETSSREGREPILAFNVAGASTISVVDHLEVQGIRVHNRVRDAYSRHTLDAIGITECVRASLCHYNTQEEVMEFLRLMREFSHETTRAGDRGS